MEPQEITNLLKQNEEMQIFIQKMFSKTTMIELTPHVENILKITNVRITEYEGKKMIVSPYQYLNLKY